MFVLGLRWGTDGGGFACGPIGEDIEIELLVTDKERLYFIYASQFCEFKQVRVSNMSLIDLTLNRANDFDYIMSLMDSHSIEQHDWEDFYIDEDEENQYDPDKIYLPDDLKQSKYCNEITLACIALDKALHIDDYKQEEANLFIEPYTDKDLDEYEFDNIEYIKM